MASKPEVLNEFAKAAKELAELLAQMKRIKLNDKQK
jgi:hypothetical protein